MAAIVPRGSPGFRSTRKIEMAFVGIALLSLLLAATPLARATPTPADEIAIPPVVWELVELSGGGESPVEVAQPDRYTVRFQPGGKVAVGADCNQAAGTYTADNGVLIVIVTVSTLAQCPPDSQSEPFLALFESAITFEFDSDGFLIVAGDDGSLKLRAALTGVLWEWQNFRGSDDAIIAPERPADYTLMFMPDGKLAIQSDCNRGTGSYSADGPSLDLAIGGVTRAKCPQESLAEQYLRDLGDVSSYVFRDGNLYLALRTDAGIMEFAARFDEHPATPRAG